MNTLNWLVSTIIGSGLMSAAAIAGLTRVFGAKWLDSHFAKELENLKVKLQKETDIQKAELQKEIETYKAQTLHNFEFLLNRKITWAGKEQEVLVGAWDRLNMVSRLIARSLGTLKPPLNLETMSVERLNNFLKHDTDLTEIDRAEIKKAKEKTVAYYEALDKNIILAAVNAGQDFYNYIEINRIFLFPKLKESFLKVNKLMNEAAWSIYDYYKNGDTEHNLRAYSLIEQQIEPLIKDIEKTIQDRIFP